MAGNAVLIVAAGSGQRLGGELPKQYLPLAGRSVLRRSIDAFPAHARIDAIRVVISADHRDLYRQGHCGLEDPAAGRPAVRRARNRCATDSRVSPELKPDNVLIHDAARPFVTGDVIDGVLAALDHHPGAIPAVPVIDTLKRGSDGIIVGTVEPQRPVAGADAAGFPLRHDPGRAPRSSADRQLTDDAALLEAQGLSVELVPGAEENFKITTMEDFERAERLLGRRAGSSARATASTSIASRPGTM